ncbi:MAG: prepilin-type N-terminal cleavage/methylation domain-containing protein [Gemmatimonadota bacterium]|nr:prepilin-type N-terminal cleavage/methylation domain-containing protein [Gemmatimonadota bacterium]
MSIPSGPGRRAGGFTLMELVIALAVLLTGLAITAPWSLMDKLALARAARLAESHLVRARLHAVARHARTSVGVNGQALELRDAGGTLLSRIDLGGASLARLDSVRVRPSTLRFNARGQGSAGSVYLYRGRRGIRVVSNFVGRVRRSAFRF